MPGNENLPLRYFYIKGNIYIKGCDNATSLETHAKIPIYKRCENNKERRTVR